MDSAIGTSADPAAVGPQASVASLLSRALALKRIGELHIATTELETALAQARSTPYDIEFPTRVELAITLAELYLINGATEKARQMLVEEAAFAEKMVQIAQLTGTAEQKRVAAGGRVQLRDRAKQVSLIGAEAPEISAKEWINGAATTLAALRGRVVLLEFWATWCKPCQEMFGKLKKLDEEFRDRGLEIIALTRHYLAYRGTASSQAEELNLMRSVVKEHDLKFRVGVAEDERNQELYGATGLPTLALIDHTGVVRYAHFGGGEDRNLDELLDQCLVEQD